MGLLTSAESGLRREADELAEGDLRSPGKVGLLLVRDVCLCLGYARLAEDLARPPDVRTAFEIGSVTKVFTAALLERRTLRWRRSADRVASSDRLIRLPCRTGLCP